MAGIGFELNKLFKEKSFSAKVRALGYSGIVVAGPLVLGIAFVFMVTFMAGKNGLSLTDRMLLSAMITYAIMASLFLTGTISLPVTRYVSDCLYKEEDENVIPSLYGSLAVILPPGAVLYLIFLLQSKFSFTVTLLNLMLFLLLCCIWLQTGYLSAVKDYRGIMLSYVIAIGAAFLTLLLLHLFFGAAYWIFLMSCVVGYGCQVLFAFSLIYDFFDSDEKGAFAFLPYLKKYFSLSLIGTLSNIGSFSHILLAWRSRISVHVGGAFYTSPYYDVPAFYAYLATLVTTIFFVTRAETAFFEKYSAYFGALNSAAPYYFVKEKREQMLTVMWADILQAAVLQVLTTAGMLSIGVILFERAGFGILVQIRSYFISLTLGYSMYATANMLTLFSMYFADYKSVLIDDSIFAGGVIVSTALIMTYGPLRLFGLGFCLGAFFYLLVSYINLRVYTANLEYEVLAKKPFVVSEKKKRLPALKKPEVTAHVLSRLRSHS